MCLCRDRRGIGRWPGRSRLPFPGRRVCPGPGRICDRRALTALWLWASAPGAAFRGDRARFLTLASGGLWVNTCPSRKDHEDRETHCSSVSSSRTARPSGRSLTVCPSGLPFVTTSEQSVHCPCQRGSVSPTENPVLWPLVFRTTCPRCTVCFGTVFILLLALFVPACLPHCFNYRGFTMCLRVRLRPGTRSFGTSGTILPAAHEAWNQLVT